MISPRFFCETLSGLGVDFYTGVPDSLLKHLCAYLKENIDQASDITAANEGGAMALAAGHYLATGNPACVFMQNSGIGNAVNPLLSLLDQDVYSIPALLVIGWRGMPGVHDEPQHLKQGRVTPQLLEAMEIPFAILADTEEIAREQISSAIAYIRDTGCQMALLIRKDIFEQYPVPHQDPLPYPSREEAIREITDALLPSTAVVSTTGMISRELYELRDSSSRPHSSDFLTVGSMGHSSQIALGIALAKPDRPVACLDGDGAFLMHLGNQAIVGSQHPGNMIHIVINNGAHDSVGGQDTVAMSIDIPAIAKALGYDNATTVCSADKIKDAIESAQKSGKLTLIEIRVRKGARSDLGRPKTSPEDNKQAFMKFL